MTAEDVSPLAAQRRQLWILWLALLTGPSIFLGVVALMLWSRHGALDQGIAQGDMSGIAEILGVAAIALTGLSLVLPSLLGGRRSADAEFSELALAISRTSQRFLGVMVPGWAMAEGGALLSIVGAMLAGFVPLLVAALALYPVAMFIMAPTSSRLGNFLRDRLVDAGWPVDQVEDLLAHL